MHGPNTYYWCKIWKIKFTYTFISIQRLINFNYKKKKLLFFKRKVVDCNCIYFKESIQLYTLKKVFYYVIIMLMHHKKN